MDDFVTVSTDCGKIRGLKKDGCNIFMGIPYAKAARFEYAVSVSHWDDVLDATKNGNACPQIRTYYEHLEIPERNFYNKEFRNGLQFNYDENCLNLNIFTPEEITETSKYPVMIFIHGGGFDSGANCELPFDGTCYAKRGIICVFINYRVGIFGYLTHPQIQKQFGRNGNFGLDDQLTAIKWTHSNIKAFGGDPENITIAGQSAGAISVQYLCLNPKNKDLFKNAIMISGGGKFPDFALPRPAEQTCSYWQDFINAAKAKDFSELKTMPCRQIFDAIENFKPTRKDNTYNTMPVIDGELIPYRIQTLIKTPLKINYMIGYTNCDLFAPLMAFIGHKFARANNAYVYFFDVDAKGDNKKAFHSSDLNYIFNTLNKSWRPYTESDHQIAELMQDYIADFVKYGNPNKVFQNNKSPDSLSSTDTPNNLNENAALRPFWKRGGKTALHLTENSNIKMIRPQYLKLIWNMLHGGKQI